MALSSTYQSTSLPLLSTLYEPPPKPLISVLGGREHLLGCRHAPPPGHGVALLRETMLQSGEDEQDIAHLTRVAHETDAPDLPLEGAQPAANLEVILLIELALDLRGVDLVRHDNGGQRVQAIGWIGEQLELKRFQPRPQSRRGVR